jgi:hypothetical protein
MKLVTRRSVRAAKKVKLLLTDNGCSVVGESLAEFNECEGVDLPWDLVCDSSKSVEFLFSRQLALVIFIPVIGILNEMLVLWLNWSDLMLSCKLSLLLCRCDKVRLWVKTSDSVNVGSHDCDS